MTDNDTVQKALIRVLESPNEMDRNLESAIDRLAASREVTHVR